MGGSEYEGPPPSISLSASDSMMESKFQVTMSKISAMERDFDSSRIDCVNIGRALKDNETKKENNKKKAVRKCTTKVIERGVKPSSPSP